MQEFEFSYLTNKTRAQLDDHHLNLRIGPIMRKEIALQAIQFFYIKEYTEYNELIIRYSKPGGRSANQKLIHSKGATGALELINALSQKFPEKDLRGKDSEEAMEIMKASNSQKMGFWMALVIMIIIVSVFFVPYFMHFFDGGHADITVEDIINRNDIGTRNVTISGWVLNAGVEIASENKDTSATYNYFPIVEDTWDGENKDPVHVVLKAGHLTQDEVDVFVYETTAFSGVIRNIWWEGLDDNVKNYFAKEYNMVMAEDVIVIELVENKTDTYAMISYAGVVIIVIIIFVIMWFRQKRRAAF